jgi:hypothetical protein
VGFRGPALAFVGSRGPSWSFIGTPVGKVNRIIIKTRKKNIPGARDVSRLEPPAAAGDRQHRPTIVKRASVLVVLVEMVMVDRGGDVARSLPDLGRDVWKSTYG